MLGTPTGRGSLSLAGILSLGLVAGACDAPTERPAAAGASASAIASSSVEAVPWPSLPDSPNTLGRMLDDATRKTVTPEPTLDGKRLIAALRIAVSEDELAGGWVAIVERLTHVLERHTGRGKRTWILVGSHHDAADQVDLFRRLVGPLGLSPAPLAAVEQLQADGAWAGLPAEAQRGDDAILSAYLEHGADEQLDVIRRAQRARNYTAWKYDYVDRIADLVIAARASGRPLIGCDMPSSMQQRLRETLGDAGAALRDLHCALAVQRALARRPLASAAVLIGDAHLAADRLPRFVPATDEVVRIHLVGGRDGGVTVDGVGSLRVLEPLLVPLARDVFALILHAPPHAARVDRVRVRERLPDGAPRLTVVGTTGKLQLGSDAVTLDGKPFTRPDGSGPVGFLLDHDGGLLAGTLDVPAGGGITLDLHEPNIVRLQISDP
jgi:hypothetical protein